MENKIVDKCLNCGKVDNRVVYIDNLGKFCECECGASFDVNDKKDFEKPIDKI